MIDFKLMEGFGDIHMDGQMDRQTRCRVTLATEKFRLPELVPHQAVDDEVGRRNKT